MPHHPTQSPKKQSSHTKKPAPKKPAAVKKPVPTKKPTVVPPKPAPKPNPIPQKPIVKKPVTSVVETPKIQPATTRGTISWTLTPEAEVCERKQEIVDGISKAVDTYNTYASFSDTITIHYDPSVATAHANGNTITFGNMFGYRVSLHEISHVLGCGVRPEWTTNQSNGVWTGANASELIKKLDGPDAVIHCDNLHFWGPLSGGLNYDSELTPGADIRHVALVQALVDDMNI